MGIDVSNTVTGGFFIGESVVNASRSGGGIEIPSNEFSKTIVGNELGFWCCFLFKGEVEGPTMGGLNIIDCSRFPLVARRGCGLFFLKVLEYDADEEADAIEGCRELLTPDAAAELFAAGEGDGGDGEEEKGPSTSW